MTLRFMHYVLGLNAIFIHVLALSRAPESYYLKCQERPTHLLLGKRDQAQDHYVLKGTI